MNTLHCQRPDGSFDQSTNPPTVAHRPRLTPVGLAVVFVLMLAIGALPFA